MTDLQELLNRASAAQLAEDGRNVLAQRWLVDLLAELVREVEQLRRELVALENAIDAVQQVAA